jgi:hypothetical protein
MNRASIPCLTAAAALTLCAGAAHAVINSTAASFTPITPGNVVVYRVGDGAATVLSNAAMPVFVDEFSPTGTLIQTIALPSAAGGGTLLTASGTATSEGLLTVSPDGRYITITGYNAALGTTGVASTATTAVARSIAVLDAFSGTTAYATTTSFSGNNIRSAVSSNGTDIWATGGNTGVVNTITGATGAGTIVANSTTNLRQSNIFDGQLYASTGSGSTLRLATVGTGLPTTTGQTFANIPGFATSGSPYAFFFADLSSSVSGVDTLYVAADDAAALTKYSLVSGSWVSNGVVGTDEDYRGVTGLFDASGNVQLYITRKGGSAAAGGGELLSLLDTSGYNGAFAGTPSLLSSALTSTTAGSFNTAFRGVGVIVPAPGASALLGIGGLLLARRRRS